MAAVASEQHCRKLEIYCEDKPGSHLRGEATPARCFATGVVDAGAEISFSLCLWINEMNERYNGMLHAVIQD
jgi:hypothetical protein